MIHTLEEKGPIRVENVLGNDSRKYKYANNNSDDESMFFDEIVIDFRILWCKKNV